MAQLPNCRTCGLPYKLVREGDEHWEFACELCQVGHVFTKPQVKAAAAQRARLQRLVDRQKMLEAWQHRPRYSFARPQVRPTKTSPGVN